MRHVYECAVRFDDLDSYGHVNNVTFLEYLQEARVDFAHPFLADALAPHEASVVVHQAIDYVNPVPFRTEPIHVGVCVSRIGTSSFEVSCDVRDDHTLFARAVVTLVAYDVAEQQPRALSAAEHAALTRFPTP